MRAVAQHLGAPAGEDEGAPAGVGLGRFEDESVAADGGGADLDGAGVEVDGVPGEAAGLADAQSVAMRKAMRSGRSRAIAWAS